MDRYIMLQLQHSSSILRFHAIISIYDNFMLLYRLKWRAGCTWQSDSSRFSLSRTNVNIKESYHRNFAKTIGAKNGALIRTYPKWSFEFHKNMGTHAKMIITKRILKNCKPYDTTILWELSQIWLNQKVRKLSDSSLS